MPRSCLSCGRGIGPFDPANVPASTRPDPPMERFLGSGLRMALLAGISVSADVLCAGCWSRIAPARGVGRLPRAAAGAPEVPLVAPFHTNDELLALVRFLKFSGGRVAAPALGWWMAEALGGRLSGSAGGEPPHPVLVPVPLHPRRQKRRGYNQAALLAREVGARLGLEVDVEVLARVRNTKAQSTLDRETRAENVRGAFGLRSGASASGRDIVLVDDLVTTGETVGACVEALERAAPRSIMVLSAGRARD
jgi:ComF family protein